MKKGQGTKACFCRFLLQFSIGWVLFWERGRPARLNSAQDGRAPKVPANANCGKELDGE